MDRQPSLGYHWTRLLFCLCLALWPAVAFSRPAIPQPPVPRLPVTTTLDELLERHSGLDINGDGIAEIAGLELLPQWSATSPESTDRVLLVLIEDRVGELTEAGYGAELKTAIGEYCDCLSNDGWVPLAIRASLYDGPQHQDGRTILALRRFFQALRTEYPGFAGAVMIGSFPESMLVRRWVWKHRSRSAEFNGVTYNQGDGPRATFLALDPELISHRSDVVLCDLDGHWDELYVQPRTSIDLIKFLPDATTTDQEEWPSFDETITTEQFSIAAKTYEDFFFIDDAHFQIVERTDTTLTLKCGYALQRPEVGRAERETANPLAQPEIMVSRINARHVAVVQPLSNLDGQGRPARVPIDRGSPNKQFARDPKLECQLLTEYLQRNIAHRQGRTDPQAKQVATMWTDLQTPSKQYFDDVARDLHGVRTFPKADAVDFVRFLKTPAILKGVSAHSNPQCSILMKGYSREELDAETGGHYWHWKKAGESFIPSYDDPPVRDRVHFALLRTLWENGQLTQVGSAFYIHGGCEAISPLNAATQPYSSPNYGGHNQIAECLLFYGNGLALIGRSKVFYDIPRGFSSAFGTEHGRFGDILTTYFRIEADDAKLGRDVAGRNRAYFWSILGDWTLRLTYPSAPPNSGGQN